MARRTFPQLSWPAAALGVFGLLVLRAGASVGQESAEPPAEHQPRTETQLCALIESAATDNDLPVGFFTRLIWKESSFRADAISPKGAQGIAQFMPGTAEERGLLDPFDVSTALPASAGLLKDHVARFGNLGLAAAAYNAGAQRVADWLSGGTLPWETQDYIASITGVPADDWADPKKRPEIPADKQGADCDAILALLKIPGNDIGPTIATESGPWGVQVAGNFSRTRAIGVYTRLQSRYADLMGDRPPMVIGARMRGRGPRAYYRVRVPMPSREAADRLCADLKAKGASCIVLKT